MFLTFCIFFLLIYITDDRDGYQMNDLDQDAGSKLFIVNRKY